MRGKILEGKKMSGVDKALGKVLRDKNDKIRHKRIKKEVLDSIF